MKETKKMTVLFLLLVALAKPWVYGNAGETNAAPSVAEFGEKEGASIQSGFVFHDGRYVEMPYRVNRKGLALYINDIMVREPIKWPPEDTAVTVDPGSPKGISEDMTFDDFVKEHFSHYNMKWRFLHQNYPEETVVQQIVEYFEAFPFIQSVTTEDNVTIKVVTRSGEERLIDVGPPPPNPLGNPPKKENAIREVEAMGKYYERRLQQGYCLYLFSRGGELSFSDRKAAQILPEVIAVLDSDKTKEEKLIELKQLQILPPQYPTSWEAMVTGYQTAPELDRRIQAIRAR